MAKKTKAPQEIQLTPEEIEKLTACVRQGASAIANCWGVLNEIGARLNLDWEPTGTSVADIMDTFASMLDSSANPETIDSASVAESYNPAEYWGEL